ncbi:MULTISPECIES: oxidoreductase [Rahnella]|uniref:Oxidoreductase n=1 Tax=Rahnella laticis TaxID=2787622 RepID=A0ABS0E1J1_9GAMM|nr:MULTISPECIES: oxidoreductase [Rahnella]MBF7978927.1 oxidoreductase [Rahnella laticis]MBF7999017.1 oxidoreductase [Rahnella sp. LAC-M12]
MSDTDIRVVTGPANYFSFPGAIDRLAQFYTPEQLDNALWIYGERALAAAQDYLPEAFSASQAKRVLFSAHCSETEVRRIAAIGGEDRQVVIGIGGGAVLDTAKVVARRLGLPVVAIPTIAATCAAWTPLSVWYNDEGQALRYEIFNDANHLVLVEPRIILSAPKEYLLAGIGDTLAKWYEAVVLSPQPEILPLTVQLGLNTALTTRDVLLSESEAALQAQDDNQLTQSFLNVLDAIIAGGGLVGGLGDRYTRIAAAHSVHNGLTALPQTDAFLHGTKVAYGILVQSALLNQPEVVQQLKALYRVLDLPVSLAQLQVDIHDEAQISRLIERTLQTGESIHLLPGNPNAEQLRLAFEFVENF